MARSLQRWLNHLQLSWTMPPKGRQVRSQVRRHELTDEEWALLAPLLPSCETRGRYYHDHRAILNGMLYWMHTGVPWRDLPERYGPWQTVYSRFRRWTRSGRWDRLLHALQRELDGLGAIEWTLWCVDGSSVRAHKHAAGAGKKSARASPAQRARRSRARAQPRRPTKLHLVTDGRGLPLAVELSAGQAQESKYAAPVLRAVSIAQPEGRVGRPRTRPEMLAGDKGYDHGPVCRWLRAHQIRAVIPEKQRPAHWRARRGRPIQFDRVVYRRCNVTERCVGWLKDARRVATRFEKLAVHYLGVLKLMMIRKHLKLCLSNTP